MANDSHKKGIRWFKGVLSNENITEKQQEGEILIEEKVIPNENLVQSLVESNHAILAKDNQDKIALDVIVSLENIIKDRQLLTYKNKGLEEQLQASNETINRFKQEQIKTEQLLQEKSKEIRELENNLTNKQMSYDQLLEDYKEFQQTSKLEYEKISNQLETQITKYNMLYEESSNTQYQSMLKINSLEEKIRNLEIENEKYTEQYQKIANEKADLMKTINDFTERIAIHYYVTLGTVVLFGAHHEAFALALDGRHPDRGLHRDPGHRGDGLDRGGEPALQGEAAGHVLAARAALEEHLGREVVGRLRGHRGEQRPEHPRVVPRAHDAPVVLAHAFALLLRGERVAAPRRAARRRPAPG